MAELRPPADAPVSTRERRSDAREAARRSRHGRAAKARGHASLRFSIAFFSSGGSEGNNSRRPYELELDIARYVDERDYVAVWTPERHFEEFGASYPNPSVLSAALAMVTQRIEIRGGSCILPLHHPIRVAEEWAQVDNLSGGRAGLGLGSGWHAGDFVLNPANYEHRRDVMLEGVETIRRLWRGEEVVFEGVDRQRIPIRLRILPCRELPLWFASGGSAETWDRAAAVGAGVYAGPPDDDRAFERRVMSYKQRARASGHSGHVAILMHTYVASSDAEAREAVTAPMKRYLGSFLQQRRRAQTIKSGAFDASPEDYDVMVEAALADYLNARSLIGSTASCVAVAERMLSLGVDEIACLVDFGLEHGRVMDGLGRLDQVVEQMSSKRATPL